MPRFLNLSIIFLVILFLGCKGNSGKSDSVRHADTISISNHPAAKELILADLHTVSDSILLRVAIFGDAEPKPLAEFPNMAAAVELVNTLAQKHPIDFVIGVGDIPHRGTEVQYEAATEVLRNLNPPFYPIMGNEEHDSTVERYLHYAQKWNNEVESIRYVLNHDKLAFVFASPDHGREFYDSGAFWILEQLQRLAPKPVVLVVHAPQKGVFSENLKKGVSNQLFMEKVISQPNLAVVISGDLHMDMDRVDHSKKLEHVHYLHIPGLERTKIPDETRHTPMFRMMTIAKNGNVTIDTYVVGETIPSEKHAYTFRLLLQK